MTTNDQWIRAAIRFEVADAVRQARVNDDGAEDVALLDELGLIDRAAALLSGRYFQSADDLSLAALEAITAATAEFRRLDTGPMQGSA